MLSVATFYTAAKKNSITIKIAIDSLDLDLDLVLKMQKTATKAPTTSL